MEIIAAGKKLSLILIYRAINWFIAYRDRPTSAAVFYTLTITARSAICGAHVVHGTHSLYKRFYQWWPCYGRQVRGLLSEPNRMLSRAAVHSVLLRSAVVPLLLHFGGKLADMCANLMLSISTTALFYKDDKLPCLCLWLFHPRCKSQNASIRCFLNVMVSVWSAQHCTPRNSPFLIAIF